MQVSGQLHAAVPIEYEAEWPVQPVWMWWQEKNPPIAPAGN